MCCCIKPIIVVQLSKIRFLFSDNNNNNGNEIQDDDGPVQIISHFGGEKWYWLTVDITHE